MLFRKVDLTELDAAQQEEAELLGGIDGELKAVKDAMARFREAEIPPPTPTESMASEVASPVTEPSGQAATRLTEAVQQVIALRQEIARGEQLVAEKEREVEAALATRAVDRREEMKSGLRFLALTAAIAVLSAIVKQCTGP